MKEEHHSKTKEELFKEFKTSKDGLSQEEAKQRLEKYGKNIIKKTQKFKALKILFEQFNSFLIYILILAAILSFAIGHNLDAVVISAIIVINAGIGFFQQYKAEKAIESLKKFLIPHSKVMREGKLIKISSEELVPGDIVILGSGDKINADCRIIELEDLQTNEAVLTGESLPIDKLLKKLPEKTELALQKNMLFTGTQVVRGSAKALVVSTGMQTHFGKIAGTLQKLEDQKTPMQKRLDKFSKQLGLIIIGLVIVVLLLGITHEFDLFEMFLVAVALAIGAIPEGLPAVLAIAFSISSLTLSKQNVIVRSLPAVETLGSVTVICSDKTGTMTKEKMEIQEIFTNNNFYSKKAKEIFLKNKKINPQKEKHISQLIKTSVLCNNARFENIKDKFEIIGDPTEKALVSASLDLGFNKKLLTEKEPSIKRFEFDSQRKMMSILRDNGRSKTLYSKGAPEKIISHSQFELVSGQIKKLTEKRKKELLKHSEKMEQEALRVLGFAYKNFSKKEKPEEKGLIFLGFAGMIDPPRPEVKKAIKDCQSAGINVKMITGDSAITAKAIADQIGIHGKSITEKELEKMSDQELLSQIQDIAIFARTTPQQKLRITKILQLKGHVVAITGDGVNDSLALKSADIGVAMGIRGTDVARDVSDIVLIDDNFASLVEGVKQGRRTYDNIKKFTKYILSVNFDTILLVAITSSLGMPLPILPLHILWKNIVTDSFPALTLVFEPEEKVMKTKPRKEKSLLEGIWLFLVLGGIANFIAVLSVYLITLNAGFIIEHVRTMALTTGILFELLFVYTCRSKKPLHKIGFFSNKWLNYAIIGAFGLHLVLIYTFLGKAFNLVPLAAKNWLLILPFAFSGIVIFEIAKLFRNN